MLFYVICIKIIILRCVITFKLVNLSICLQYVILRLIWLQLLIEQYDWYDDNIITILTTCFNMIIVVWLQDLTIINDI